MLKKYQRHKIVEAGRIDSIGRDPKEEGAKLFINGVDHLVSAAYMEKHKPLPGGYYVRHEDGYESFSPAEAFEAGYTEIVAEKSSR